MDKFMDLAKKGIDAYTDRHQSSDQDSHKTGGREYNSPDNSRPSYRDDHDIDRHEAVRQSAEHHESGETSIFETAMSFLDHNKERRTDPIDEEHVTNAHHQAYGGGGGGMSASALGGAAALEALKKFTSSGHDNQSSSSQTKIISMAMSEAAKLFDSKQTSSGNKQDAVNGAAMTVMKLIVQSKLGSMSGGLVGGGNSGGLSSLMSLASKFA